MTIERLDLPGGVLDDSILARVAAIAQQCNCVGCNGRGLAAGVAEKLPYRNCPRMPPANKIAVPERRSAPGTIDVRRPATRDQLICAVGDWRARTTACSRARRPSRPQPARSGSASASQPTARLTCRCPRSTSLARSGAASPVASGPLVM